MRHSINKKNKKLVKLITFLLLPCFATTTPGWAAPSLPKPEIALPSLAEQIDLPETIGSVKKRFVPENHTTAGTFSHAPVVIHIQDAHANYEAQINTKKILDHLTKQYGIRLLLLEGGVDKIKPRLLQFFTESKLNQKTADLLAKDGIVTGAELFMLDALENGNFPHSIAAYGVEDPQLFKTNLRSFRHVLKQHKKTGPAWDRLKSGILTVTSRHFNKKLKDFFRQWLFYQDLPAELAAHINVLQDYATRELGLDLTNPRAQLDWPHLLRFLRIKNLESQWNPDKASEEKLKLVAWIEENKVGEEFYQVLRSLGDRNFKLEEPRSFFERFYEQAATYGFSLENFPHLTRQIAFLILNDELDSQKLFEEMSRLTEALLNHLIQTEAERLLISLYQDWLLLRKLFALELVRDEFNQIEQRQNQMRPTVWQHRFKSAGFHFDLCRRTNCLQPFDRHFTHAFTFYQDAKKREKVIFQNMVSRMKHSKSLQAVLITGGFHSEGLLELMKQQGMAYVVIAPHISEVSPDNTYKQIMSLEGDFLTLRSHIPFAHWTSPALKADLFEPEVDDYLAGRVLVNVVDVLRKENALHKMDELNQNHAFQEAGLRLESLNAQDRILTLRNEGESEERPVIYRGEVLGITSEGQLKTYQMISRAEVSAARSELRTPQASKPSASRVEVRTADYTADSKFGALELRNVRDTIMQVIALSNPARAEVRNFEELVIRLSQLSVQLESLDIPQVEKASRQIQAEIISQLGREYAVLRKAIETFSDNRNRNEIDKSIANLERLIDAEGTLSKGLGQALGHFQEANQPELAQQLLRNQENVARLELKFRAPAILVIADARDKFFRSGDREYAKKLETISRSLAARAEVRSQNESWWAGFNRTGDEKMAQSPVPLFQTQLDNVSSGSEGEKFLHIRFDEKTPQFRLWLYSHVDYSQDGGRSYTKIGYYNPLLDRVSIVLKDSVHEEAVTIDNPARELIRILEMERAAPVLVTEDPNTGDILLILPSGHAYKVIPSSKAGIIESIIGLPLSNPLSMSLEGFLRRSKVVADQLKSQNEALIREALGQIDGIVEEFKKISHQLAGEILNASQSQNKEAVEKALEDLEKLFRAEKHVSLALQNGAQRGWIIHDVELGRAILANQHKMMETSNSRFEIVANAGTAHSHFLLKDASFAQFLYERVKQILSRAEMRAGPEKKPIRDTTHFRIQRIQFAFVRMQKILPPGAGEIFMFLTAQSDKLKVASAHFKSDRMTNSWHLIMEVMDAVNGRKFESNELNNLLLPEKETSLRAFGNAWRFIRENLVHTLQTLAHLHYAEMQRLINRLFFLKIDLESLSDMKIQKANAEFQEKILTQLDAHYNALRVAIMTAVKTKNKEEIAIRIMELEELTRTEAEFKSSLKQVFAYLKTNQPTLADPLQKSLDALENLQLKSRGPAVMAMMQGYHDFLKEDEPYAKWLAEIARQLSTRSEARIDKEEVKNKLENLVEKLKSPDVRILDLPNVYPEEKRFEVLNGEDRSRVVVSQTSDLSPLKIEVDHLEFAGEQMAWGIQNKGWIELPALTAKGINIVDFPDSKQQPFRELFAQIASLLPKPNTFAETSLPSKTKSDHLSRAEVREHHLSESELSLLAEDDERVLDGDRIRFIFNSDRKRDDDRIRSQILQLEAKLGNSAEPEATAKKVLQFVNENKEKNFKGEEVHILNGTGPQAQVIGRIDRNIAEKFGYIHETANVIPLAPDGSVILQLRNKPKDKYDDHLAMYGGHLEVGQSHEESVLGETKQETGIQEFQSPQIFIGYESYDEWNEISNSGDPNRERRSWFLRLLTVEEFALMEQKKDEEKKAAGASHSDDDRATYKAKLRALSDKDKDKDKGESKGRGEVTGFYPFTFDQITGAPQKINPDSKLSEKENRFLTVSDTFEGNEVRTEAFFTPDALDRLVKTPDLWDKVQRLAEIIKTISQLGGDLAELEVSKAVPIIQNIRGKVIPGLLKEYAVIREAIDDSAKRLSKPELLAQIESLNQLIDLEDELLKRVAAAAEHFAKNGQPDLGGQLLNLHTDLTGRLILQMRAPAILAIAEATERFRAAGEWQFADDLQERVRELAAPRSEVRNDPYDFPEPPEEKPEENAKPNSPLWVRILIVGAVGVGSILATHWIKVTIEKNQKKGIFFDEMYIPMPDPPEPPDLYKKIDPKTDPAKPTSPGRSDIRAVEQGNGIYRVIVADELQVDYGEKALTNRDSLANFTAGWFSSNDRTTRYQLEITDNPESLLEKEKLSALGVFWSFDGIIDRQEFVPALDQLDIYLSTRSVPQGTVEWAGPEDNPKQSPRAEVRMIAEGIVSGPVQLFLIAATVVAGIFIIQVMRKRHLVARLDKFVEERFFEDDPSQLNDKNWKTILTGTTYTKFQPWSGRRGSYIEYPTETAKLAYGALEAFLGAIAESPTPERVRLLDNYRIKKDNEEDVEYDNTAYNRVHDLLDKLSQHPDKNIQATVEDILLDRDSQFYPSRSEARAEVRTSDTGKSLGTGRSEVEEANFVKLAEAVAKQGLLSRAALENIRSWARPAYRRVYAQITREFQKTSEETDPKKHKELWTEIDNAWYTKAAPGTGGMRGKLGLGTNRISEYTLGLFQLAHALAVSSQEYNRIVEEQDPDFDPSVERKAVILGGDSRHQSYDPVSKMPGKLIKLEALLNVVNGTRAYVYRLPVSTPQVAWSIHQLDVKPLVYHLLEWLADSRWFGWFAHILLTAYLLFLKVDRIVSGSMNTASHNPRTDNGSKPYKPDGSQSTGEFAILLSKKLNEATPELLDRLEYEGLNILDHIDLAFNRALKKGDIQWIGGDNDSFLADEQFMKFELEEAIYTQDKILDPKKVALQDIKIVISPLYGVSRHILEKMLRIRGLHDDQIVWVESEPNPDFPGVKGGKPNPEEPQARLQALVKAQEVDADLVLWTDPDADRPAVAFKTAPDEYLSLNGNQQLAVITDYLIRELREVAKEEKVAEDSRQSALARQAVNIVNRLDRTFVASTVVSGDLMKVIARNAGLQVVETLTGFKYIGDEIEKRAKTIQWAAKITEREWRELSKEEKIRLALQYSELFLFGGEESLGSLTSDGPHDKDAIAGLMWFIEIAGRFRKQGVLIPERLNAIYKTYGYFAEGFPLLALGEEYGQGDKKRRFSEAEAMQIIKAQDDKPSILGKLRKEPPNEIAGKKVIAILDFDAQRAVDREGKLLFDVNSQAGLVTPQTPGIPESFAKALERIPVPENSTISVEHKHLLQGIYSFRHQGVRQPDGFFKDWEALPRENFVMLLFEDGSKVIVRPSGTEPVIKFYMNARSVLKDHEDIEPQKKRVDDWIRQTQEFLIAFAADVAEKRFPRAEVRSEVRTSDTSKNFGTGRSEVRALNQQEDGMIEALKENFDYRPTTLEPFVKVALAAEQTIHPKIASVDRKLAEKLIALLIPVVENLGRPNRDPLAVRTQILGELNFLDALFTNHDLRQPLGLPNWTSAGNGRVLLTTSGNWDEKFPVLLAALPLFAAFYGGNLQKAPFRFAGDLTHTKNLKDEVFNVKNNLSAQERAGVSRIFDFDLSENFNEALTREQIRTHRTTGLVALAGKEEGNTIGSPVLAAIENPTDYGDGSLPLVDQAVSYYFRARLLQQLASEIQSLRMESLKLNRKLSDPDWKIFISVFFHKNLPDVIVNINDNGSFDLSLSLVHRQLEVFRQAYRKLQAAA